MKPSGLMGTLPGRLFTKMNEDNAFNWAVILAWNFLQSIFPIVLVMAAVIALALGSVGVGSGGLYGMLLSFIPDPKAQEQAIQALNNFQQRSGIFFLVGFIGLLWTGAGLFRAMEQAFAVIYHSRQRSLVRGLLVSFGMILLLTLLGGLMLVTTTLLGLLSQVPLLPALLQNGFVAFGIQAVIGVISGFVLFGAIYYFVPHRHQDWGNVWPGALLAGVLFELITLFFPLYLRLTGAGAAYGKTFGLLFLLMIFFYFLGIVTMIGVELNSLLYPIPVDQPDGKESLVTPLQSEEAPSPRTPSRAKGVLALGVLWLIGAIRAGRRRPT